MERELAYVATTGLGVAGIYVIMPLDRAYGLDTERTWASDVLCAARRTH